MAKTKPPRQPGRSPKTKAAKDGPDRGLKKISRPIATPQPAGGPRPLYLQVKDFISGQIDSGAWPPEFKVPSENELVARMKVSRMTANRALRELTAEGRLVRVQGLGTFVARPQRLGALFDIRSIADEIAERGGRHTSDVLLLAREKASPQLAAAMGLAPGREVFHSIIIHRDNGLPVQYSDRYVNPAVAPGYLDQDFTVTTPSQYLLETAPIQEAEHVLEAARPEARVRKLLEIEADEPCLVLHRQTWSGGVVATRSWFVYPGSRYRLGGRFSSSTFGARPGPA